MFCFAKISFLNAIGIQFNKYLIIFFIVFRIFLAAAQILMCSTEIRNKNIEKLGIFFVFEKKKLPIIKLNETILKRHTKGFA